LVNTDVLWPEREWAESQVLRIQTKLHQWAIDDPDRRFDDLFNLVCDPAVLVVAWARVRGNRGKRSAGVDGLRPDAVFSAEEGSCRGCEKISRPDSSLLCLCGNG
jgi:RNA-directed DNA polymerase